MDTKNKSLAITGILSAFLIIALFWAYWPILKGLFKQLLADEDYSFGLLLPLVSGYITFLKWPRIRREPLRPTWMGMVVLALGLIIYILGEASTDLYSPRVSFVVSLTGIIMLLGGWQIVRLVWFPLLLLFLMIPLPHFIMRQLTLPLQLISSRLATEMLQSIGIPAVRQGNIIDLGVRQLQIVAACSGLRYILSLMAMGIIYCFFYQQRLWKAAILMLFLIPAAIVANALRVAGMGIYPALQQGFWHSFSGWLIFVFCLGFLIILDRLLSFRQPRVREAAGQEAPQEKIAGDRPRPSYSTYLVAALAIVMVSGYFARAAGHISPVPLLQSFDNFPLELGPWQGKRTYIDPAMFAATGADTYLEAEFFNPERIPISLWIAYYENQKGGGSVHSPFTCLTGGGWSLVETGITHLAPDLPVRYMVMEQGGRKHLIYYWYLQRGRWLTSEYLNKLYLSYDGLFTRRADGALIRLISPVGADVPSAHERLVSFAKLLVPLLPQFIQQR